MMARFDFYRSNAADIPQTVVPTGEAMRLCELVSSVPLRQMKSGDPKLLGKLTRLRDRFIRKETVDA
jgi:hypothetical protein